MNLQNIAKQIAIALFGVIVPIAILSQAYFGLASLGADVNYTMTLDDLVKILSNVKKTVSNDDDYALFSLLYTEHANQKTMINKQIMKVATMQIGFAVTSIGMMLIIFGFNDGGAEGTTSFHGIQFDFKSGSTGVVVFLVGALMATAGGIVKNDYNTVPIPDFGSADLSQKYSDSLNAYIDCEKKSKENLRDCFVGAFEKINQGVLK